MLKLIRMLQFILWISFLGLVVLWNLSIHGDILWVGDMLQNFAPHMLVAFIAFMMIGWIVQQHRLAQYALLLAIMQSYRLYDYIPPVISDVKAGTCLYCDYEEISLFQYNVLFNNNNIPHMVNWLLEDLAYDMLVFQEVNKQQARHLQPLAFAYPFQYQYRDIAIFSRLPLQHVSSSNDGSLVEMIGQTRRDQTAFHMFAIHTASPMNQSSWEKRNHLLIEAAHLVAAAPMKHKMLVGDFNAPSYSRWFERLLSLSGLTQQGKTLEPSWSPYTHRPVWAGMRIDHALTSEALHVTKQELGPDFGSDHLPVITHILIEPRI